MYLQDGRITAMIKVGNLVKWRVVQQGRLVYFTWNDRYMDFLRVFKCIHLSYTGSPDFLFDLRWQHQKVEDW